MKILISSKLLAGELSKIDFDNETLVQVRNELGLLILNTDKQTIEI